MACCEFYCRVCHHEWAGNGPNNCPVCFSSNVQKIFDEDEGLPNDETESSLEWDKVREDLKRFEREHKLR